MHWERLFGSVWKFALTAQLVQTDELVQVRQPSREVEQETQLKAESRV